MTQTITFKSQNKAARLAGLMFLITMTTSVLSLFYFRSSSVIFGNIGSDPGNVLASEGLFRIGIALDLITFSGIVLLPLSLYIVLKPVNKYLALLGLSWRLAETIVLFVMSLFSFFVLQLLSGEDYLTVFDPNQIRALVKLFLKVQGAGFTFGMIFLGLGGVVFNYLFYKSKYIPKLLAAWGIFASLFMILCFFVRLLLPQYSAIIDKIIYLPIFIDEVILGLWLLIKGIKQPKIN